MMIEKFSRWAPRVQVILGTLALFLLAGASAHAQSWHQPTPTCANPPFCAGGSEHLLTSPEEENKKYNRAWCLQNDRRKHYSRQIKQLQYEENLYRLRLSQDGGITGMCQRYVATELPQEKAASPRREQLYRNCVAHLQQQDQARRQYYEQGLQGLQIKLQENELLLLRRNLVDACDATPESPS
jgi:hypothetical protein